MTGKQKTRIRDRLLEIELESISIWTVSQLLEAEEMTRARYKAAKERILKMSIYDQKSLADTQAMISQFFYLSGIQSQYDSYRSLM